MSDFLELAEVERLLELAGAEEPEILDELFRSYNALDEGIIGVRFFLARRLLTASMLYETPSDMKRRSAEIRSSGKLNRSMVGVLEKWAESPFSPAHQLALQVDSERMRSILEREVARLSASNVEIIANTVSFQAVHSAKLKVLKWEGGLRIAYIWETFIWPCFVFFLFFLGGADLFMQYFVS